MSDLPVKPHRKTLQQTSIILNISVRTVRRYLDNGRLQWSGNQVLVTSIEEYLKAGKEEETDEQVERLMQETTVRRSGRRVLSQGIG